MGNVTKCTSILLVLLVTASIITFAAPAFAQSAVKPLIPQFTVELSGPAFDVPPTYVFNPNTAQFDVNEGYHYQYSTVKIVIENQPFTNQSNYDFLYYNVRIKPHNYVDSYWQELFHAGADGYPIQTVGNTTVIPIAVEGTQASGSVIGVGGSTDIQVEAMIGYIGRNQTFPYEYIFYGETSDWSSTQTVTVPPKTPFTISPTTTATSTPTVTSGATTNNEVILPLAIFIGIIAVLSGVICVLSLLLLRRTRTKQTT